TLPSIMQTFQRRNRRMAERFPSELIGKLVERLRAVADESRIRLLLRLREKESYVTELADELGIGQATVSKHLAVLKRVGLFVADRRGTQAVYRSKDESVFEMCSIVCDGVVRHRREEHSALADALGRVRRPRSKA